MSTAVRARQDALLGPNSHRLEVGLLGARTAAVLRRIIEGATMDEVDQTVMRDAISMMTAAAEAVAAVEAGGPLKRDRHSFGFGAMAFTVEFAAPQQGASGDLPGFLRSIAEGLAALLSVPDPDAAKSVLPPFSMLAEVATRQAGTVGEGSGYLV